MNRHFPVIQNTPTVNIVLLPRLTQDELCVQTMLKVRSSTGTFTLCRCVKLNVRYVCKWAKYSEVG
jgi:hypothetical protein